ncbi:hypothetical protein GGR54DRAFT_642010 [Hypoxylon sp. NC1633]|nr:hypothetical protein GGR54DRAFT_642010 [Hypoxylon sp. NC1633]
MDEKLQALLTDIRRQLHATPTLPYDTSTESKKADGLIKLETQSYNYHLQLQDLYRALPTHFIEFNGVGNKEIVAFPTNQQDYLWKILAFSSPSSPYLDSDLLISRCVNVQKTRNIYNFNDYATKEIWQSQHLQSWARAEHPSLIVIQGNSQSIRRLEQFSLEITTQLRERYPTIFVLSEPTSRDYFLNQGELEVLRQLAIQALRLVSTPIPAGFLVDMFVRFQEASTSRDWFDILERIFQFTPSLFLVVDFSAMDSRINRATAWPFDFEQLITRLNSNASTRLWVMLLLSSHRISLWNLDAPVINKKLPIASWKTLGRSGQEDSHTALSSEAPSPPDNDLIMGTSEGEQSNQRREASPVRLVARSHVDNAERGADPMDISGVARSCSYLNTTTAESSSHAAPCSPSHRRDFAIAIFCALTLESDAVEPLFDQYWDMHAYGKSEGDMNTYSVGMVGRHNVVLVHMPGMGKGNAATAAANCRASFPGIRLALVVGICGGVPFMNNLTEIILGDVVISDGLVHYDFGRQFPDGFRRKETMLDNARKQPEEVRSFLSKLKGRRSRRILSERSNLHLNTLHQELGDCAAYPGTPQDRLFEPTYRHRHQLASMCADCQASDGGMGLACDTARALTCEDLGCDLGRLVPRQRHHQITSSIASYHPIIHFGTFASGDKVMKSGEHRDQIARQEDIIAFEMEGAGIWEIFPCVIIKGVCDYADSHKNKKWQDFAAATAAACMKAFLEDWALRARQ